MAKIIEKSVENGFMVRAEENGKSVGFGIVSLEPEALLLENIHVEPMSRRTGLGRVIFDALIHWGQDQGAKTLTGEFKPEFGDQNAKFFYERMGVEITADGMLYKNLT